MFSIWVALGVFFLSFFLVIFNLTFFCDFKKVDLKLMVKNDEMPSRVPLCAMKHDKVH